MNRGMGPHGMGHTAPVWAAIVGIALTGCFDSGPTGVAADLPFTQATIYEDDRAIRTVRSDGPRNNFWYFRPDPRIGSHPPEGEGAATLVRISAGTYPETASAGGKWVTVHLTGRGVSLPFEVGRYPVAAIPAGEELDPAHLGIFGGILHMGRGITSGLDRSARTTGGELVITRVSTVARPGHGLLVEGRIEVTLEDLDTDGQGASTLRAEIRFLSHYRF